MLKWTVLNSALGADSNQSSQCIWTNRLKWNEAIIQSFMPILIPFDHQNIPLKVATVDASMMFVSTHWSRISALLCLMAFACVTEGHHCYACGWYLSYHSRNYVKCWSVTGLLIGWLFDNMNLQIHELWMFDSFWSIHYSRYKCCENRTYKSSNNMYVTV